MAQGGDGMRHLSERISDILTLSFTVCASAVGLCIVFGLCLLPIIVVWHFAAKYW